MVQGELNDGLPDVDIDALMEQADSAAGKMAAALGALQKTTSRMKALRGRKTSPDLVDTDAGTDSDAGQAGPPISEGSSERPSTSPEHPETADQRLDEKTGEDEFLEHAGKASPAPPSDNISEEEKPNSRLSITGGGLEQTELAVEMVDELMDEVVRQVDPQTDPASLPGEESLKTVASDAGNQSDMDDSPADSHPMPGAGDENSAKSPENTEPTSTESTPDDTSNTSEASGEDSATDFETDQIGDEESVINVAEAALAATELLIQDIQFKEDPPSPADSTTADSNQSNVGEKPLVEASVDRDTGFSDPMDAMDAMEALVGGMEEESRANASDDPDVEAGSPDKKDPIDEALSSMEDLIENLDQGPAPERADDEPTRPTHEDEEGCADSGRKQAKFEAFDRDNPNPGASSGETASGDTVLKASPVPNDASSGAPEEPSSARENDADSVLADMETLIAEASADSAPAENQKDDTAGRGRNPKSNETPSQAGDPPARREVALAGEGLSIGGVTEGETTGSDKQVDHRQTPKSAEGEQAFHSADSTGGRDGDADETVAGSPEPKPPLTQRASQLCLGTVQRVFRALDAPFSGMQGRWKTLAGYLALGTLFMALTAWVISSFGNLH